MKGKFIINKTTAILLALLMIVASEVMPQSFSVHRSQKDYFGKEIRAGETLVSGNRKVSPPYKLNPKNLNKIVFGYLPFWVYLSGSPYKIDYDLITHIALFDFPVSSDGSITEPLAWPWTDVISEAHSRGVKVVMSVSCFDRDTLHIFLNNPQAIYKFIEQVKNVIRTSGLDGINVDFEWDSKPNPDKNIPLSDFLARLSSEIKNEFPQAEISFASPPVNFNNGFDLLKLSDICDYLFIMAYEYYGWWSSTTGPVAPLTGDYSNITTIFENVRDYSGALAKNPQKLLLGVPYYGALWQTDSPAERAAVVPDSNYVEPVFYYELKSTYSDYEKMWSDYYSNSWYRKNVDSAWMQLWIDDDSSMALKYDLAIAKKIGGIGIWALGYDGDYDDLWNVIRRKFTSTDVTESGQTLPDEFILFNNYPNPFNPSTTIQYSIPAVEPLHTANAGQAATSLQTTLKIYDLLGREITTLFDGEKSPGTYEVKFNAGNLPGGIYFCRMTAGGFSSTIKMILLK